MNNYFNKKLASINFSKKFASWFKAKTPFKEKKNIAVIYFQLCALSAHLSASYCFFYDAVAWSKNFNKNKKWI